MSHEIKPVLLGELLTRAGILTPEMLNDALQRAKETKLPLGKVVIWSGYLNDRQLQAAIEAQSLINDKLLTLEVAVNALAIVFNRHQTLDIALDDLGWTPGEVFQRNRLGDLLSAAEMVSPERLQDALNSSSSTSLPLGQVLACSPEPLGSYVRAGLTAQSLIREGKIQRERAIEALRLAKEHSVSFEQALFELGIREASILHTIELSELLLASSCVTQSQFMRALDRSLETEKPLSVCLLDLGYVKQKTIDSARHLRNLVHTGAIGRSTAAEALRRVHEDDCTTELALSIAEDKAAAAMPKISATDLLRLASLVTDEDVQKVLPTNAKVLQDARDPARLRESIDENTFRTLMECLQLIERNAVNLQQAIVALHVCLRKKLTLADSLRSLGIKERTAN